MKVLILGASGFVGRNVKEYLEQGKKYEVYSPTSRELNCIDEDAVTNYLRAVRFDYVLLFAVYGDGIDHSKDGTKVLDYNLRIFLNFAKNSDLYGKMYYTGSGAEYDKRFPISHVEETEIGKTIPVDQYGLMKYIIGQIIEKSSNLYNFRLFGIFGKYEYWPVKFISNICCKAIKGIPFSIRQNVYFDYLWIEDFCRMIEFFLEHEPKFHTYNMVSGQAVSLQEICQIVNGICQKELPVYICKDGWGNEYTASNKRFMKECIGFQYTPIAQSIGELYRWYAENEKIIDIYKLFY